MAAHKTKDGRWREWLDLGSNPATGQRIRKKVEAKTKSGAEMKAKALRERHDRGEHLLDKPRTLGQLLDDWIATVERQGKADNTLIAYRGICTNHLKPRMGAIDGPKLRARDIQKVFNELADQFASSPCDRSKRCAWPRWIWRLSRMSAPITPPRRFAFPH